VARFADGTIQWAFAAKGAWGWVNTGHVVPANAWTHLAVVYDRGTVATYVGGRRVHVREGKGVLGDADPAKNEFRIGGRQHTAQFFAGLMDEVRVYDRALTEPEIRRLASPPPGDETVWLDDALPQGAQAELPGTHAWGKVEPWDWVATDPKPAHGAKAHRSIVDAGVHQHSFVNATDTLAVEKGDRLFAHVYLDPQNTPRQVMLQ
jgi:hypothetical protein